MFVYDKKVVSTKIGSRQLKFFPLTIFFSCLFGELFSPIIVVMWTKWGFKSSSLNAPDTPPESVGTWPELNKGLVCGLLKKGQKEADLFYLGAESRKCFWSWSRPSCDSQLWNKLTHGSREKDKGKILIFQIQDPGISRNHHPPDFLPLGSIS